MEKFKQVDSCVYRRMRSLRIERKGRHLRAGEADRWDRESFWGLGLHKLRTTVQCPGAA
jgi:RNA-directed DNA polymerase